MMDGSRSQAKALVILLLLTMRTRAGAGVTAFLLSPVVRTTGNAAKRRVALLNAKPKRRATPKTDATKDEAYGAIPANLRRKITAKRPTLGHIVPKAAKEKQQQQQQQRQQQQQQRTAGGTDAPQLRPQGQTRQSDSLNNPSMLKVMGGTCRGRRLDSPQVFLRPMMGKVKEAVFSTFTAFGLYDNNSSSSNSITCRHLDIFAGSGSVGIESLSRGANHCTFVDLSDDCCRCIQRNLDLTGLFVSSSPSSMAMAMDDSTPPQTQGDPPRVICADAMTALTQPTTVGIPQGSKYQIVTLCPPYEEVVYGDLLEAVVGSDLVTDDTVVLVEYPVELGCLPHVVTARDNTAVGVRNRRYGRTVIALYVINPTGRLADTAASRPEEFVQV